MDVRLARPTDAPLVLSLALDDGAHLVRTPGWPACHPVVPALLRSLIPLTGPGRCWVARDGNAFAVAAAQPRPYVIGWDITRLAVRGDASLLLGPLVRAVTGHMQARGVPRLFARCREDACPLLQSIDFAALAREFVLLGPQQDFKPVQPVPLESRYRMRQDDWPLHQLEHDLTPPLIRQLEGLTSLDWAHPVRAMSEIVVEREGRVVAWVGWGSKPSRGMLHVGMLIHPEHGDLGPTLIQHAQRQAPMGCRLVARVRDYQAETLRSFTDAGFVVIEEEMMMIKHAGVESVRFEKPRIPAAALAGIPGFHLKSYTYPIGYGTLSVLPHDAHIIAAWKEPRS